LTPTAVVVSREAFTASTLSTLNTDKGNNGVTFPAGLSVS
jgi:hypothetical protein